MEGQQTRSAGEREFRILLEDTREELIFYIW
jgi:hypothetical protein